MLRYVIVALLALNFSYDCEARRLYRNDVRNNDVDDDDFVMHGTHDTTSSQFALNGLFFHEVPDDGEGQFHSLSINHGHESEVSLQNNDGKSLQIRYSPLLLSKPAGAEYGPIDMRSSLQRQRQLRTNKNLQEWTTITVPGPAIDDKDTVVNLAKMCNDAYVQAPSQPDWLNTTMGFNRSDTFGWKGNGLRGHVFTDKTQETVIIAFKGTSIDPRDGWSSNDRFNDNLLFSCCCATQRPPPWLYPSVCNCRNQTYQCNSTCLTEEILQPDRYYVTALNVMQNISSWYPMAQNFWVVGHSLGGAMASLMGLTFGIPAVSYEAVPERLSAQRLGLANPPPLHSGGFHIGNTADPNIAS
ncbi:hypothetical protein B0A52_01478 [Exophiala mesophila]|uniref:Putative lipase ATG15 n=1 Tax=Exophiala mesophila TaxID=212818 RepID=A0A438NF48_EXOME|nr:hypothetical protein B0A52_01478 [Exophiala mesophila]